MPLPCPYRDDYWTEPDLPNEEVADLFDHLGSVHHPDQEALFRELAARMRNLDPVP